MSHVMNVVPVYVLEERVLHDLLSVVIAADTLARFSAKELLEKVDGLRAEVAAHWDRLRLVHDIAQHLLPVLGVQRRSTTQHLIEDGAERPPVGRPRVARRPNDFRSEILWRAAEAIRSISLLDALLGQTKVRNTNVTLAVKQNILRLEVAIDDISVMECTNGNNHFSNVHSRSLFGEALLLAQIGKQLTTVQEVNEEVQLDVSLERVVQADDIRVLHLLEDVSLSYSDKTC